LDFVSGQRGAWIAKFFAGKEVVLKRFPPEIDLQLEGWKLDWFDLHALEGAEAALAEVWPSMHDSLRDRYAAKKLTDETRVSSMRRLFRRAGCDPTRYRPSSEALLRRVLKGHILPRIHPFVDLNNLLSMELLAPCCVIDLAHIEPPFVFRSGVDGEWMQSMRGAFDLKGKPLLADARGPFGTPITDSQRVKVTAASGRCWLVVYRPLEKDQDQTCHTVLERLLHLVPAARMVAHTMA
jgi:DNA/RNA-binding domain of Phe-tRNA-synthetase-like protein